LSLWRPAGLMIWASLPAYRKLTNNLPWQEGGSLALVSLRHDSLTLSK